MKSEEKDDEEKEKDVWPMWTLTDLVTSIDPEKMQVVQLLEFGEFHWSAY